MHAAFAILTALEHRARTGEGQQIEQAMIDLAGNLNIEQVLEHSAYGHLMERLGNRQPGTAHQGVYATSEPEQWVALRCLHRSRNGHGTPHGTGFAGVVARSCARRRRGTQRGGRAI